MPSQENDLTREEKLEGYCGLGYIDFRNRNSYGGTWAQATPARPKGEYIPNQLYTESEFTRSRTLSQVNQADGAILNKINPGIGAPRCTFVFGAIAPDEVWKFADNVNSYLRGPSPDKGYTVPYTSAKDAERGNSYDNLSTSNWTSPFPQNLGDFPTIPTTEKFLNSQYNVSPAPETLVTYNIWELDNLKILSKQDAAEVYDIYRVKGYSFKDNPGKWQGPWMLQDYNNNTVYAVVESPPGIPAYVTRKYGLGHDLIFDPNAKIYYPTKSKAPDLLNLTSDKGNTGFHLNILHNECKDYNNNLPGTYLEVEWGLIRPLLTTTEDVKNQNDLNDKWQKEVSGRKAICSFRLEMRMHDSPVLFYKDPNVEQNSATQNEWTGIELNGPSLSEGPLDIYVHFAGPMMLIGFTEDPLEWNVFSPVQNRKYNTEDYWYPRILKDDNIRLTISNMTCKFQYSPIAFNNFDPDMTYWSRYWQEDLYYSRSKLDYSVPSKEIAEKTLQDNAYLNPTVQTIDITQPDYSGFSPTYYADWRGYNHYNTQLGVDVWESTNAKDPLKYYTKWNTTLEGPMFICVGDEAGSKDDVANSIKHILDLSHYLTKWSTDYTAELSNHSFMKAEANVTLKNLVLTDEGRNVLALLEENVMLITLGAGYGESKIFFQGLVKRVETTYEIGGSTTTLSCSDLAWCLFNETRSTGRYLFLFHRFIDIIRVCAEEAGLGGSRFIYDDDGPFSDEQKNKTWLDAIRFRAGRAIYLTSSTMTKIPSMTIQSGPIMQSVLSSVLESIFDFHVFPVMYWDLSDIKKDDQGGKLCFTSRQKDSDTIYFLGIPGEEMDLPGSVSHPTRHGVIEGTYQTSTETNNLVAGYFFGSTTPIRTAINRTKNFSGKEPELGMPQQEHGWVGFRKIHYEDLTGKYIQTENQLMLMASITEANTMRYPYSNVTFTVHVTKPLKHWSQFSILTFTGEENSTEKTDKYGYQTVQYEFDKEQNLLTAKVTGETFPPVEI